MCIRTTMLDMARLVDLDNGIVQVGRAKDGVQLLL